MDNRFFERPIFNSPFRHPQRHSGTSGRFRQPKPERTAVKVIHQLWDEVRSPLGNFAARDLGLSALGGMSYDLRAVPTIYQWGGYYGGSFGGLFLFPPYTWIA
jgi:hypothetical protein